MCENGTHHFLKREAVEDANIRLDVSQQLFKLLLSIQRAAVHCYSRRFEHRAVLVLPSRTRVTHSRPAPLERVHLWNPKHSFKYAVSNPTTLTSYQSTGEDTSKLPVG
jgi:hypothetical protein